MRNIVVRSPKSDDLVWQLKSLIDAFSGLTPGEKVNFDMESVNWCCPLLVLPISSYICESGSTFTLTPKSSAYSYLLNMDFPHGVSSVTDFGARLQMQKTFSPISVLASSRPEERARLEEIFLQMVYKQVGSIEGTKSAIYYPITELIGNIFEHSKIDKGYVFAQFYPKKQFLDICIVDCGRGLAGAYQQEKGLTFSDEKSIEEVLKGNSTKPGVERGYGVKTSKSVVCKALGGGFILASGNAVFISKMDKQQLISLPNFNWRGLIVAYRIPIPKGAIDITKYLE